MFNQVKKHEINQSRDVENIIFNNWSNLNANKVFGCGRNTLYLTQ